VHLCGLAQPVFAFIASLDDSERVNPEVSQPELTSDENAVAKGGREGREGDPLAEIDHIAWC